MTLERVCRVPHPTTLASRSLSAGLFPVGEPDAIGGAMPMCPADLGIDLNPEARNPVCWNEWDAGKLEHVWFSR